MLEPNRAAPAAGSGWPLAWAAWLMFVVYGSLVPLEFRALDPAVAWQQFLQIPMLDLGVDKRADWVANGVLYVPVGFFTAVVWMGAQAGTARRMAAVLGAVLLGWALAVAVEFAQLFFPPRTASLNDLLAEGLGTVVGAALAWRGSGWARRFLPALRTHWPAVAGSLLPAYAAVLVLMGLFPFDLLLSGQELAAKWQGGLWGPWLAPALAEVSGLRLLVRLAVETLVVVPLGWLWARRAQGASPLQALVLGGLFGLGMEALQLLVASGVSQGVSVLTRALGWALGNWLWLGRTARPLAWWRTQGLRWRWPWAGAHLLALAWLAGWFGSPVLGAAQAVARLAGDEIRFLPLYYHYYTTEAVALASLTAVALMYAPAGAWLWVRGQASVGGAAALGAALACVVETGKLFFQATRPDPTNVLVAAAAAALALWALQRVAAAAAGHAGAAGDAGDAGAAGTSVAPARAATAAAAPPARRPPPRSSLRLAPLGLAVAVALAAAWFANAPLPNLVLGALALATSALVWWRPVLVFALLPVALPLLDLAPWSGPLLVDEFDLLLLLWLAVATLRLPPARGAQAADPVWRVLVLALVVSLALGWMRGFQPWQGLQLDALGSPVGPWQAFWLGLGALWALALYRLAERLRAAGQAVGQAMYWGLVVGLLGVALVVVWERVAFVSLWDWSTRYRVAGPFSAMNVGGAYVEAYLVVGLACALHAAIASQVLAGRVLAVLAAALGSYALAVTFSRGGYAAGTLVVLTVPGLALWRAWLLRAAPAARTAAADAARRGVAGHGSRAARPDGQGAAGPVMVVLSALLALATAAVVAWPIVSGPYARERLASDQVIFDLAVREVHWQQAWRTADLAATETWLGHGLGQYAAWAYWRGQALPAAGDGPPPPPLAVHRFVGADRDAMLQIGPGPALYVDQIIRAPRQGVLTLQLQVRAETPEPAPASASAFTSAPGTPPQAGLSRNPALGALLCRKWLLTSQDCQSAVWTPQRRDGEWLTLQAKLDASRLGADTGLWARPVRLSLLNTGAARADVRQVSLRDEQGRERLRNGSFRDGGAHWTFTSDDHLGWHLKNLALAVWFELGLPGLLALGGLLALALWRGAGATLAGKPLADAWLAALAGFLTVAALDTLVEEPRFLLLLLLLAWVAAHPDRAMPGTVPRTVPGAPRGGAAGPGAPGLSRQAL